VTRNKWFRLALIGAVCALAAILLVPSFSADRFRPRLLEYLEETLQSPVEVEEVRYALWGGPGFQLKNVVIADVDATAAEPFAYVGEVWLRLGIASLWTGDLVVSRVTLVQPSLNIASNRKGEWNYTRLLQASVSGTPKGGQFLPEVQVDGGRINFREGLRKSVYYFRNANLKIVNEGIGGDARLIEFRAEPARTDSYAPRFGTVHGHGRWRPGVGHGGDLDLDVGIERSPVPELAALLGMPRAGLSGYARALAHLSGPADNLSLRGSLELQEPSEWPAFLGFLGWREGRGVTIEGEMNLPARRLSVRTVSSAKQASPRTFSASFELFPPEVPEGWRSSVEFKDLPIERLQEILQLVDDTLPSYPQLQGVLTGQVDYRSDTGLRGSLRSEVLTWQTEDTPAFSLRETSVDLEGDVYSGKVEIVPVASNPGQSTSEYSTNLASPGTAPESSGVYLEFQGSGSTGQLGLRLSGGTVRPEHLSALALLTPGIDLQAPVLGGTGWSATGAAQWQRANYRASGSWNGSLRVRRVAHSIDGFRLPIQVDSGILDLRGANWSLRQMRGTVGRIAFQGEIHHQSEGARPYQLALTVNQLDLNALDSVLPLNSKQTQGFLQRTFSRTRERPAWVKQRAALVKILTNSVVVDGEEYKKLCADLYWHGEELEFRNVAFESRLGTFRGAASVNLSGPTPLWTTSLAGTHPSWDRGILKVELRQSAEGGFVALFGAPRAHADVVWEREEVGGQTTVLRAELAWPDREKTPEICKHCVELRNPEGIWIGSCGEDPGAGYRCQLEDAQTGQQVEVDLPISMVGVMRN
jgi:hypothetical protein